MESADLEVLLACQQWREQGFDVALVTVVRTWGSSPRPPGALMAIRSDGRVSGSVSGGCIEDDLIHQVHQSGLESVVPGGQPQLVSYGVDAEQAHRFGLPCGGTLQLAIERLGKPESIAQVVERLRQRLPTRRMLDLESGQASFADAMPGDRVTCDGSKVVNILGPAYRLIVIGAGQLSRYFCQTAVGLGFDVTVCDPREEYRGDWDVPGTRLTHDMPDDVVLAAGLDARTGVIALTHDPKLDDLAIMEALRSPAFYVGALGSRANHEKRVARLREYFDLTAEELSRLRGPAGIFIGSRTPGEIALSILTEIVATKNGIVADAQVVVRDGKAQAEHGSAIASATAASAPQPTSLVPS
ncbi:XdhC family protein [Cupriavidus sp. 2SB]|uniref:XdhC family protein n=1 Tax=Cupriavidus sp. 2SB TaxID=2502199 RepID=UPI0010F90CE5|nr:XdhC family protein [Cupriavidus sp. 2SB]